MALKKRHKTGIQKSSSIAGQPRENVFHKRTSESQGTFSTQSSAQLQQDSQFKLPRRSAVKYMYFENYVT